jgi:hypothetical protein
MADSVPLFGTQDGAIRVRHREFVRDIQGSMLFNTQPFVINPSNGVLMPWLASFAQSFEQYRLMGMVVEFKSTSGNFGIATPALGSVMIATQYNTRVAPFGDKSSMLNHFYGTSSKASESMMHPIECKDAFDPLKVYYIRNNDEVAGVAFDARMEDYAVINVATQGQPLPPYITGELWVTYDVLLYKPRIRRGGAVLAIDPLPVAPPVTPTYEHIPEWAPLATSMSDLDLSLLASRVASKMTAREQDDEKVPEPPPLVRT